MLIFVRASLLTGCFHGYSALAMAEALPEEGSVVTVDKSTCAVAQANFEAHPHAGKKITLIKAMAADFLADTTMGPWDFIYVDADKNNYHFYLALILQRNLLSATGVIVVDNCLWKGEVVQRNAQMSKIGQTLQSFNDWVSLHPSLEKVMLPVRDGLYVLRRK